MGSYSPNSPVPSLCRMLRFRLKRFPGLPCEARQRWASSFPLPGWQLRPSDRLLTTQPAHAGPEPWVPARPSPPRSTGLGAPLPAGVTAECPCRGGADRQAGSAQRPVCPRAVGPRLLLAEPAGQNEAAYEWRSGGPARRQAGGTVETQVGAILAAGACCYTAR